MGYEQPLMRLGLYPADVDLSGLTGNYYNYQFAPIWLGTAANIQGTGLGGAALQLIGTNTTPPLGILQNNPIQGEAGLVLPIGCGGITKAKIAGTCAIGNVLTWNAGGTGLVAAASGSGKFGIAIALETGSAGDISAVLLANLGNQ